MNDRHVKNETDINDEFLVRYLAGEASPEEAMLLHQWLALPENQVHFDKLQTAWHRAHPTRKPRTINREQAWQKLATQLTSRDVTTAAQAPVKTISINRYSTLMKAAAAVLLVMAAAVFAYLRFYKTDNAQQVNIASQHIQKDISLPDQSHVILNRNSNISYAEEFKGDVRQVNLSGEAYFDVKHLPGKPFVVHTALADIKVLGTAFNVTLTDSQLQVSVARGRVLVYTRYDSTYLEAGHTGTVLAMAGTIKKDLTADSNLWGYATRQFKFRNTPLREVFRCIEKSYPCSISINNPGINNCRFTATLNNVSAEYVLSLIAETLDLTVTKNDHEFVLEGKGCQ